MQQQALKHRILSTLAVQQGQTNAELGVILGVNSNAVSGSMSNLYYDGAVRREFAGGVGPLKTKFYRYYTKSSTRGALVTIEEIQARKASLYDRHAKKPPRNAGMNANFAAAYGAPAKPKVPDMYGARMSVSLVILCNDGKSTERHECTAELSRSDAMALLAMMRDA